MIEHIPQDISFNDQAVLDSFEEQMRSKQLILEIEATLRASDPELYREISDRSSQMAPGNPRLHAFYFTEFLILAISVKTHLSSLNDVRDVLSLQPEA